MKLLTACFSRFAIAKGDAKAYRTIDFSLPSSQGKPFLKNYFALLDTLSHD
ncbi:MAG: hypothetical protein WBA07_08035 [Rivularia sp. (in: cyanobacteria)]